MAWSARVRAIFSLSLSLPAWMILGPSPALADSSAVTAYLAVPGTPDSLVVSPDGTHVYVTASLSSMILDLDPATGTIRSRIPVGDTPRAIAFSTNGSLALVSNITSQTVSVIDVPAGRVIRTIPVPESPEAVAFSRDGRRGYVTHTGLAQVTVIDPASGAVLAPIALPDDWTESMAAATNSDTAVALQGWRPSSLAVLSLAGAGALIRSIPTGGTGIDVAINADASRAYVLANDRNLLSSVLLVDLASGTVLRRTPIGLEARALALNPDGTMLLVAHQGSLTAPASARGANAPMVTVLDAASLDALGVISASDRRTEGARAESLGLGPTGSTAWLGVYQRRTSAVAVLDTATPLAVPGLPQRISARRTGSSALISWSAPSGSPTRTLVNAVPNAEGDAYPVLTCSTAGQSCRIRGLIPGVTYQVTVQARNGQGWGPVAPGLIPR